MRRRTHDEDALLGQRLRAALPAPGWVPPDELPDEEAQDDDREPDLAAADASWSTSTRSPTGAWWRPRHADATSAWSQDASAEEAWSDGGGLDHTWADEPGADGSEHRDTAAPALGTWVTEPAGARPGDAASSSVHEPPGARRALLLRFTDRLPDTVRGARTDPGRRGAAALVVVALLAASVAVVLLLSHRPVEVPVAAPSVVRSGAPLPGTSATPRASPPSELVVSVAGTVVRPGLVRLPPGSRVDDAVTAAGGLAPGGSYGLLNLARKLVDGEQVVVGPQAGSDASAGAGGVGSPGAVPGPVDLNAATAAQLDTLPGVGPVLAQHIVDWRTEHGPFASVDQLREVPGIGESKFAQLKTKVRV